MIFLDTNVISETLRKTPDSRVMDWLSRWRLELALPVVTLAEIAFGIERIRPQERAKRLEQRYKAWTRIYTSTTYLFNQDCAYAYASLMANAERFGRPMSVPDGMIAAIALVNGGRLATRNIRDFETTGLDLVSPWRD